MRDTARIQRVLDKIQRIWNLYPDQRFFQLLFNYTMLGERGEKLGTIKDPFFVEDDILEEVLDKVMKELFKEG